MRGAAMPEAGHYGYKKTDGICDGVCGEVSPTRPPHPHPPAPFTRLPSLPLPFCSQICAARRGGRFFGPPGRFYAADAWRIRPGPRARVPARHDLACDPAPVMTRHAKFRAFDGRCWLWLNSGGGAGRGGRCCSMLVRCR